ncbi:MAG TPA: VOC family protein [Pyrinomonadaceae bacterium]|jgi:PhnB protein|nr:VOC family protein [Pyrinomonadaceae bacterium]
MAERSIIDQLDDAVAAIAEGRQLDLTNLGPELSMLVGVAQDLIGLPRETFKAELQQQLIRRDSMSSPASQPEANPVRSMSIYICVANANAAIDFYREAFGAKELWRLTEPSGKIGYAELQIGNTNFTLSDEYPDFGTVSPNTIGGSSVKIHLDVTDVDTFAARAIEAGAVLVRPISDQFHGNRLGQLADPFGYTWVVSTHLRDVPVDEMQRELDKWAQEREAKNYDEAGGVKEPEMRRENRHAVTPYITVHQPAELIDFVTQAFGAIEHFRATGSAGGMHAEVSIGDSIVMIGGAEHIEPMPTAIHLYVPDVDQAYERALKAGAKSLMPVTDQSYGERSGGVEDAQGNRWYIATPFVPLKTIAEDLHTVTVYFHPIGAQRFIDFVTTAFDGKELMRHAEGDMIMHAKLQVGDSVIELGEARYPTQPLPTAIYLYVDDVDAKYEQALKAGGTSMLAPTDQPYGDRNAWVKDPFDNVWYVAAPLKRQS